MNRERLAQTAAYSAVVLIRTFCREIPAYSATVRQVIENKCQEN